MVADGVPDQWHRKVVQPRDHHLPGFTGDAGAAVGAQNFQVHPFGLHMVMLMLRALQCEVPRLAAGIQVGQRHTPGGGDFRARIRMQGLAIGAHFFQARRPQALARTVARQGLYIGSDADQVIGVFPHQPLCLFGHRQLGVAHHCRPGAERRFGGFAPTRSGTGGDTRADCCELAAEFAAVPEMIAQGECMPERIADLAGQKADRSARRARGAALDQATVVARRRGRPHGLEMQLQVLASQQRQACKQRGIDVAAKIESGIALPVKRHRVAGMAQQQCDLPELRGGQLLRVPAFALRELELHRQHALACNARKARPQHAWQGAQRQRLVRERLLHCTHRRMRGMAYVIG